jgi:hypothetical protein
MNKKTFTVLVTATIFLFFLASNVYAANIALVVQNKNSLSEEHEIRIYNFLKNLHDVTLVDKDVSVDYHNFDLIVIANNPFSSSVSTLNAFIKDIPVNEVPTLSLYPGFLDDWGWAKPSAVRTKMRTDKHSVLIEVSHPITKGFEIGEKVYVHLVRETKIMGLAKDLTKLKSVATPNIDSDLATIAFAASGTQLYDGKTVSNSSSIVYFGIVSSMYWTDEAFILFNNSINWLLGFETLPQPPESSMLSGPSSSRTGNVIWTWTEPFSDAGVNFYQFQVALDENFTTLITDVEKTSRFHEIRGLDDTQTYYARVRAVDWLGQMSEWSNVVKTVVDFSDTILTILSPLNGTKLSLGQTIFVNATVQATRVLDGSDCTITIGNEFAGNITYNQTLGLCSGYITIPTTLGQGAFGLSDFTLTVATYLGSANSTSINVIFERGISVSIATSKPSYAPNETASIIGEVFLPDNNRKVSGAVVIYSVAEKNISGTTKTNSEGRYSFEVVNLELGKYTVTVIATYELENAMNSISFSVVTSVSPPLPSLSSSATFVTYPNMTIDFPKKVNAYSDVDISFKILVKNTGDVDLHNVKITIPSFDGNVEVSSSKANIPLYASQYFDVVIHTPEEIGTYRLYINAYSDEINVTENFTLEVLERLETIETTFPILQIVELVSPIFYENESATINFTLENIGNSTANATVRIILPERWTTDVTEKRFLITEGEKEKISFNVVPSNESGNISISVSYLSQGEEKQLTEISEALVKVKEGPLTITGLIAVIVSAPEFYLPVSTVAIILVLFFAMRKIIGRKPSKIQVREIRPRKSSFYDENLNYEKWEGRHRKV